MAPVRTALIVPLFAAVAAAGCLLGGCARPPRDVTSDSRYHGGFAPRQVYVLARDAAALGDPAKPVFLYRPEELPSASRALADHYNVIPAGARVRVSKFVLEDHQVMPTLWVWTLRVYGEMLDGPLVGKLAELHGLSEHRAETFHPDPAFLRIQEAGGKAAP